MITGQRPDPARARMMDVALVLYADHGMNASTFGATVAASTLADLYSTVVGAIATLKGPLHGGAIAAALNTIETIGKPHAAEKFVRNTPPDKEKKDRVGERVHKNYHS